MRPILFHIGYTSIYSYYVFITLGIFLGLFFFYKYSKKSDLSPVSFVDISLISLITAYIGARLFHILFVMPKYYLEKPIEMFYFWNGGFVIYGAILIPPIFVYLYAKKKNLNFPKITDALAPAFSIGTALGRLACFMQGCCYGKPTDLPWGISFPEGANAGMTPTNIPLHPTQLYLALQGLVIFLILNYIFSRKKFDGELTLWFFILYPVTRIIIEYYRSDFRGDLFEPYLSTSQFISLIAALVALGFLIKKYVKHNN
jgi:phosphatidylglycerol---prolipoprotein diacylglyceryl transferase